MPPCEQADLSFELDETLYPLAAVQNAVYVFTDRAYVRVERAGEAGRLKAVMTIKEGTSPAAAAALKGEFDNELIHQVLRQRISDSNQKIREFIVTKALLSAQPPSAVAAVADAAAAEAPCPECASPAEGAPAAPPQIDAALEKEIDRLLAEIESGDGAADPLGVSVPWEEAHGEKPKQPAAEEPKTPSKEPAAKSAPAKAAAKKAPAKAKAAKKGKRK